MQALQIWGTNFNYVATRINTRMAALGLPCNQRSRRQVKLKYNREEKSNPRKVDRAIKGQVRLCTHKIVLVAHCGCVLMLTAAVKDIVAYTCSVLGASECL